MDLVLPLDRMTVDEKLRALERIWEDLSRDDANLPSPPWHGDVLAARQARAEAGQERFIDWDEAKRRIRESRRGNIYEGNDG